MGKCVRIIPIGAHIRYSYLVLTKKQSSARHFYRVGHFYAELRFFPKIIIFHWVKLLPSLTHEIITIILYSY